jgi:enoyl-CoA hydratase
MMGEIVVSNTGVVATIVISNGEKLNAIDLGMWRQLREAFGSLGNNPSQRCVVIQGAGDKAFSVGADISEFEKSRKTRDQVSIFHEEYVWPALAAIAECDVPVVAKIRGMCMGGGLEIASMADLRLADTSAQFGIPVGKLGFPLAFAETQALFNLVGRAVVAELLIEGRVLDAAEAHQRGLVTRTASVENLEREVDAAVSNICSSGILAARSHKRQLRRLMSDSSPVTPQERLAVYEFADTDEYRDGILAFLRKRRSRRKEGAPRHGQ